MNSLRQALVRLFRFFRPRNFEAEMAEEMRQHLDVGLLDQRQQVAGAIYICCVHGLGIAHPQPIVRRDGNEHLAVTERRTKALRIAKIANHCFS